MAVMLRPTENQRVVLAQLDLPERIAVRLDKPSLTLDRDEAEALRDALTHALATRGFDADYRPTDEGRLIEGLIDDLFVP